MELNWRREIMCRLRNLGKKKHPIGLCNATMSCYVNSVLQCLTYSPPLANYCLQRKHSYACPKSDNKSKCPMCLLEYRIVRSLSEAKIDSEAPETIISNLEVFGDCLSPHEQTDAQEFLDCVINACDESEKSNKSPNNESAILNKMFQSVQTTVRFCVWCGNSSQSDEILNYLPLPLSQPDGSFTQPGIVINLNESLNRYFTTEFLNASSPCKSCKRISPMFIERSISKPPNVLLLTLQRFWVDVNNFDNSRKIFNSVPFPESLSLREYVTSPNEGEHYVYSLYAIIVHHGIRMSSGHYVAYVKDADNCWFRCDDEVVSPLTIQEVLEQQENVYMLFYIRQTGPQNDGVTCNYSKRPLSHNSSVTTVSEYSTKSAISKPNSEGRGEDILEGSTTRKNKSRFSVTPPAVISMCFGLLLLMQLFQGRKRNHPLSSLPPSRLRRRKDRG